MMVPSSWALVTGCMLWLLTGAEATFFPSLQLYEGLTPVRRGETAPNEALFFDVSVLLCKFWDMR